MTDDAEHLQSVLTRMSAISHIDVFHIRNNRGQTLLDLAIDRGKQECVNFLQHLQDVQGDISMEEASRKPAALRNKRQVRAQLSSTETMTPGRPSFAGCVCGNLLSILSLVGRFPRSPLNKYAASHECVFVCVRVLAMQL